MERPFDAQSLHNRLSEAANSNHGLQLEALQVREILAILDELAQVGQHNHQMAQVLDEKLTHMIGMLAVMLERYGPQTITDEDFAPIAGRGIDVQEQDEGGIRVGFIEETNDHAQVPDMQIHFEGVVGPPPGETESSPQSHEDGLDSMG